MNQRQGRKLLGNVKRFRKIISTTSLWDSIFASAEMYVTRKLPLVIKAWFCVLNWHLFCTAFRGRTFIQSKRAQHWGGFDVKSSYWRTKFKLNKDFLKEKVLFGPAPLCRNLLDNNFKLVDYTISFIHFEVPHHDHFKMWWKNCLFVFFLVQNQKKETKQNRITGRVTFFSL